MKNFFRKNMSILMFIVLSINLSFGKWSSQWVYYENDKLAYKADDLGNAIPDFSRVGYKKGKTPPDIAVKITLNPSEVSGTRMKISDSYLPVGAKTITIPSTDRDRHSFVQGPSCGRSQCLYKVQVYKHLLWYWPSPALGNGDIVRYDKSS